MINNQLGTKKIFALPTSSDLVLMKEVEFSKPYLQLDIYRSGIYNIEIQTFTDKCQDGSVKSFEKCKFNITYEFNATDVQDMLTESPEYTNFLIFLGIGLVTVSLLIILMNVCKCFKKAGQKFYNAADEMNMGHNESGPNSGRNEGRGKLDVEMKYGGEIVISVDHNN